MAELRTDESSTPAVDSGSRSGRTRPAPKASAAERTTRSSRPPSRRRRGQERRAAVLETRRRRSRYAMVYDTRWPKVRLGAGWALLVAGALALAVFGYGVIPLAVLYSLVSGFAAFQTAGVWLGHGERPNQLVAAAFGMAIPFAAVPSTALGGLAFLALAAGSVIAALVDRAEPRTDPIVAAGHTVRATLFGAVAATSVVLVARAEIGAAITLLALVSIYEMGDFLIGSGSANPVEGPLAGIVGVAAVAFGASVIVPPPFTEPVQVLWFGALVAVAAPIGQLAASAVLPRSGARSPALRRLDSLIVVGPIWAVLLWLL